MHIARNEQIYPAVFVIIRPRRARAEPSGGDARFVGDVFELAISQVVIERVAAVAGDVNIGQAVVIVIGHDHCHAPAFARETRSLCDVGESKIGILMVKCYHGIAALPVALDGRSVHRDDVKFAVVIAVDQPGPATHRLHDVLFFRR